MPRLKIMRGAVFGLGLERVGRTMKNLCSFVLCSVLYCLFRALSFRAVPWVSGRKRNLTCIVEFLVRVAAKKCSDCSALSRIGIGGSASDVAALSRNKSSYGSGVCGASVHVLVESFSSSVFHRRRQQVDRVGE